MRERAAPAACQRRACSSLQTWVAAFETVDATHLVYLLYLANDVMSHSRGKEAYVRGFSEVWPAAARMPCAARRGGRCAMSA